MIVLGCDSVRERLPDLLAERLSASDVEAVRGHLAECETCADDLRLLEMLRSGAPQAPAGLERRIVAAVTARRTAPVVLVRRRMLIAAAVAVAVLGGGLLFRAGRGAAPLAVAPDPASGTATVATHSAAAPLDGQALMQAPPGSVEADGLSAAVPSLDDLSVSELQSLLTELKS